jgi:hypothetical protein
MRPESEVVQVAPLSVERKILLEPAKISFPLVTSDAMPLFEGRPEPAGIQLSPLFVEMKTPLAEVPAKMRSPLTAREGTLQCSGRPEMAGIQLFPLLSERKMPLLLFDPANRVLSFIAQAAKPVFVGKPESIKVQVCPKLLE